MGIHLCSPNTAPVSPRLPQPFLCWEKGWQSNRSHLPTASASTCTQFPGHLDSSTLTAGPRSTLSGASTLPSSHTDPQAHSRCGEMEEEAETAQNPHSALQVRLRLRSGQEQSLRSSPQKDHRVMCSWMPKSSR